MLKQLENGLIFRKFRIFVREKFLLENIERKVLKSWFVLCNREIFCTFVA